VDRRDFLHTATIGVAAGAAPHAHSQDADEHDHQAPPSDLTLRVKALESLLVEKGLVDPAALDAIIETIETKVGPHQAARVVARAWVDADYKRRLLANTPAAIAELGYTSGEPEHMVAIESTEHVHNLWWRAKGLPMRRRLRRARTNGRTLIGTRRTASRWSCARGDRCDRRRATASFSNLWNARRVAAMRNYVHRTDGCARCRELWASSAKGPTLRAWQQR
jgi:hypothetical protein